MLEARRFSTAETILRINAIRRLFRKFRADNTPEARGLRLMRDWLSPSQREQFDKSDHFDVVGGSSGRHYRVYHVLQPNVYEIDVAGRHKMILCFAPLGDLAKGDVMLAQKIALEVDEENALARANWIRVDRGWSRRVSPDGWRHFFHRS